MNTWLSPCIFALTISFLSFTIETHSKADIVEDLIVNGEFEDPDVDTLDYPHTIPGWNTTGGTFELWDQGYLGSPGIGSDGLGTNQHMELNAENNGNSPIVTQQFVIPLSASPNATFDFDSWFRSPGSDFYMISGSVSGTLVQETQIIVSNNSWIRTTETFAVTPGETVTVQFRSGPNGPVAGAHLDQVQFRVSMVPEPSIAFVILPIFCAGFCNWRKSRHIS